MPNIITNTSRSFEHDCEAGNWRQMRSNVLNTKWGLTLVPKVKLAEVSGERGINKSFC